MWSAWAVTYRLLPRVVKHVGRDINRLALNLVGPAAVVAYAADDGADVAARHADGLAIVERLDRGEQVGVLLAELGELEEQDAALLRRRVAPRRLKGLAGRLDGQVDVLLGGLADGADDLLGGGVDDLKGLFVDGLDPFVVDEAACKSLAGAGLGRCETLALALS